MCLERIIKQYKKPNNRIRIGWKLLDNCVTPFQKMPLPISQWTKAVPQEIKTEAFESNQTKRKPYISGFHVFLTKQDAEKARKLLSYDSYIIHRIRVRQIRFLGIDGTDSGKYVRAKLKCWVADQIYVYPGKENNHDKKKANTA